MNEVFESETQFDKPIIDEEHGTQWIHYEDIYSLLHSSVLLTILAVIFLFFVAMIGLAILLIIFSIWL